ncbi:MAG: SDR family oxidoreductase [Verrucomicrobia bacterium]|nr:SDR family oxidoreductase [Verrucomicrobiota bacterium]
MSSLKGRVAVVTGGAQNFGLEIATGLGEAGADLAITSRDLAKATRIAADLATKLGVRVFPVAMDLLNEEAVKQAFVAIHAHYGRIDVLVNNAGGHVPGSSGDVLDENLAAWNGYVQANLTGTFLCTREAARFMAERQGGSIINIASITSLIGRDRGIYADCAGMKNPVGYTAAKAGVLGLTFDAAADLARFGIRVNAISPGGFERGQPAAFVGRYSARTMLGRMGRDGWDLKGPVAFLASEAARYITGQNLLVDGGFTHLK